MSFECGHQRRIQFLLLSDKRAAKDGLDFLFFVTREKKRVELCHFYLILFFKRSRPSESGGGEGSWSRNESCNGVELTCS